jgi:hypothetical protein
MSYAHCRQRFFENLRRKASVKSATAKMIKTFREKGSFSDKYLNRQKSVLTPGIIQDIQTAISFAILTANTG